MGFTTAYLFGVVLGGAGLLTITTQAFGLVELLALVVASLAGVTAGYGSWSISRDRFRTRNYLCIRCGYPLSALPSDVCPECGKRFSAARREESRSRR